MQTVDAKSVTCAVCGEPLAWTATPIKVRDSDDLLCSRACRALYRGARKTEAVAA
jgi:hypothetical protein